MRFEVLDMLYRATEGHPDREINAWGVAVDLGIWHAELFRVVEWLERNGFLRYCGAGPTVCLTRAGVNFVELDAGGRRSIRERPPQ